MTSMPLSEILPKGSAKKTELSLGGTTIRVKTDATPATLKQIRELVEAKFEGLADKLDKGVSAHQLTVLVAYSLAEELLEEKERVKAVKRRVMESSERLLNRVGTHLGLNETR